MAQWDGTERRADHRRHGGDAPVTNNDLDEALTIHAKQERNYVSALHDQVMLAFPDGPESHRVAHEQMIAAAKAEESFWRELKLDLAKKGLWGIVTILCGMVVLGFGAWISAAPPGVGK